MAAALKKNYRDVVCGECQRTFLTNQPRKLFCDPCGIARRRQTTKLGVAATKAAQAPAIAEIAALSAKDKSGIVDRITYRPDYLWSTAFRVPFAPEMSKNRRWSNNGSSTVYLTGAVRHYQDALIACTKRALAGQRIAHNKVWVGLFVQKPNHRFDAINAVDTVCDAIKQALGIDDRWFCLDRVDWEVKKLAPEIFIQIGQETDKDALVCSHCGKLAELEDFPKNSTGPLGRDRACLECRKTIRSHARKARVEITSRSLPLEKAA